MPQPSVFDPNFYKGVAYSQIFWYCQINKQGKQWGVLTSPHPKKSQLSDPSNFLLEDAISESLYKQTEASLISCCRDNKSAYFLSL